jgi:hypothetical protein
VENDVALPTLAGKAAGSVRLVGSGPRALVAVEPSLVSQYIVWAATTLAGPPRTSRLGTEQAWWSWHLTTLAVLLVLAAFALLSAVALALYVRNRNRPGTSHGRRPLQA